MSVGESVHPGSNITVTLTSMLPFAEYSVRKMTVSCVSHGIRYLDTPFTIKPSLHIVIFLSD